MGSTNESETPLYICSCVVFTKTNFWLQLEILDSSWDVFLCLKGNPLEDAPEALITSTIDLDNRLSRLVSKVLSCKNKAAELNPTAMEQQLKEALVRFKMTGCMTREIKRLLSAAYAKGKY